MILRLTNILQDTVTSWCSASPGDCGQALKKVDVYDYSDHCNYFDNRDYFHHAIILMIILTSEINIVITFMIMMVS